MDTDRWTSWLGFLLGMGVTSVSLSSGFIWAYQDRVPYVFGAAFCAWWGYLIAHYARTGHFIDAGGTGEGSGDESPVSGVIPDGTWRKVGVLAGASILVAGMVVGVVYIRAENHLRTNVGGVLFLGGYVIAHYAETDHLL